jgi:hypothetical protein
MQTQLRLLHDWTRQVERVLVGIRVTQARPLAVFTLGLIWTGQITLRAVAQGLPFGCHPLSTERRLRRWLANTRVAVPVLWAPLVRSLLPRVAGSEVVLVFDPTPFRDRATLLILSVVIHKRALPLSWRVMPQQEPWPHTLRPTLTAMLAEVGAALPPATTVTLLADRGLVGPTIIDACRAAGWHLVLRLRGGAGDGTRVQRRSGQIVPLPTLLTRPGQHLVEPVRLFKAAGWRPGWLTIHWARGATEPWVLFSDRPGGRDRVREYRLRMRVEATYQDWKRRGFVLEHSRITDLARLDRLLLVLVLATWWLHGLGHAVMRSGQRRYYDRPDRRDRSLLQLGRAHVAATLAQDRLPPLPFRPTPAGFRYRWTA